MFSNNWRSKWGQSEDQLRVWRHGPHSELYLLGEGFMGILITLDCTGVEWVQRLDLAVYGRTVMFFILFYYYIRIYYILTFFTPVVFYHVFQSGSFTFFGSQIYYTTNILL